MFLIRALVGVLIKLFFGSISNWINERRRERLNKKIQETIELTQESEVEQQKLEELKKLVDDEKEAARRRLETLAASQKASQEERDRAEIAYQKTCDQSEKLDDVYRKHQKKTAER